MARTIKNHLELVYIILWMTLGVIAFRVPGKLEWDSKNQRFTNSDEANKYVRPVFGKGWELKL